MDLRSNRSGVLFLLFSPLTFFSFSIDFSTQLSSPCIAASMRV